MSDEHKPCRYCGKPVANQHDWDTVPEGEGVGLCWGHETCMSAEQAIDRLHAENSQLRDALDTLTLVIGLTPIAGNKEALQEAFDNARKLLA